MPEIRTILIANRGEIAVRIVRTLREMGIRTIAVHSDPDADAPHVRAADEAAALGGTTSAESYLRGDAIIAAARERGADAIHPGFGFLSENAAFAEACAAAGLVFIGPLPDAIRRMGDKIAAKTAMAAAGVPVVPGWSGTGSESVDEIARAALDMGFPLLVKAAAGGGGKGMRVVEREADLRGAIEAAQREAQKAFGDARVFVERWVRTARHVEIQVLGDAHGNVVHCFERECSIQRRHQKIVEESPSPALDPALRDAMGAAAVAGATAIGYRNAGTFEFIVEPDGRFWFLEVNTRLQVEHPVTEMTTGLDLVRLQVMIARGEPLPFAQDDLRQQGHAIECRLYAEDPARGFLPSTGRIGVYEEPSGPGVRVDSGVAEGSVVSVHYDPMLAKIVAWAPTRDAAIDRMLGALRRTCVLGVVTNAEFLAAVLAHPEFRAGRTHTRFLDEHGVRVAEAPLDDAALVAAALAAARGAPIEIGAAGPGIPSPWASLGAWRNA